MDFEASYAKSVGEGLYFYTLFFAVGFWGIMDGGLSLGSPIIESYIANDFKLTQTQQGIIGSATFTGALVGNTLTFIGDKLGRKPVLVALNGLLAVIFYFESIAVDFEFFIALKFFEQIAVQLGLTLSFTILAESLPSSKHGTYLSLVGINFSFGEVMSIGNLYFNLPDYRKAYLWISLFTIPYLITFVAAVQESPAWLWVSGKKEAYLKVTQRIGLFNGVREKIKIDEISEKKAEEQKPQEKVSIFSASVIKVVLSLATNLVIIQFIFSGMYFMMPRVMESSGSSETGGEDIYLVSLYSTILTLPNVFLSMVFVKLLGGRKAWALAYLIEALAMLAIFFLQGQYLTILISIVKICLLLSFTFAYNYMGSGLPTEIRAGAIGFASAIGKLGSISMPFIVMFFYNMGKYIPYLVFALCAIVGSLQTFFVIKDSITLKKTKVL